MEARVRASFGRQAFMGALGAELVSVAPGEVVIALPFRAELTQQHGFLHAGAIASVADSACGYAALTLAPAGATVLSVEFKVNLLRPASGTRFRGTAEVAAERDGAETVVALMQATIMTLHDRSELVD
jgi:uncharacterized protein (TIGR00369 family)